MTELQEQVKTLTEQVAQPPATANEDFDKRVAEEVDRRVSQPLDVGAFHQFELDKQQAVAEAVRATQEAADARLADIVANKDKELAEGGAAPDADMDVRIAQAVQTREAELREAHEQEVKSSYDAALKRFKQPTQEKIQAAGVKHGEKLFAERWEKFKEENPEVGVSQEVIDKAVEAARKQKDEEIAEKVKKAEADTQTMMEFRNKLVVGKLQNEVAAAKMKLEAYGKQFGPLPTAPGGDPAGGQQSPATQRTPQQPVTAPSSQQQIPLNASKATQQAAATAGQHPAPVTNVLKALQQATGRGGGIPRGRGAHQQGVGRGAGQGQGRGLGQRLSGPQHPPPQQQPIQGQRPAVNRPVPAAAGSPTTATGQGQQRRQSGQQQQQSQLPRPAAGPPPLNAAAASFLPGGIKRPRDDEGQGGQGNQGAGQKRTRVANNAENPGNAGQQ
jgi:hypothetical protein